MRAITSATAASALDIAPKQLDNLLGRIESDAIGLPGRQGRARRIPIRALPELAVTLELVARLGVGMRQAHAIAVQLCTAPEVTLGALRIGVDLAALTARIDERLVAAIEADVTPRRGRPARRSR